MATDTVSTQASPGANSRSINRLARGGAIAGLIKLASAGLSFLMFIAIALVTDQREFGLFSATFAAASLVSFFATVGQHATVLRFWPQYAGNGAPGTANGMMARSLLVALGGLVVTSLGLLAAGFVPGFADSTPEWLALCASGALLSFAMGWSEFASGAFRAKSVLVRALLPRDVLWRAAVIAVAIVVLFMHGTLDAVTVTLINALTLLLCTLPQAITLARDTLRLERTPLSVAEKAEFRAVTLGLWGATALPPALSQVSTLLVAAILGPEAAGALFVADRATRLVLLALLGINQALAPEISGAFHGGDRRHVQRISGLAALASSLVAVAILSVFVLFGPAILGLFDPSYATGETHAVLVILALGATFATMCGPIEVLLQLTGLHNTLMQLLVFVNGIGLVVTAVATSRFGAIGAAVSIAGTLMVWNSIAAAVAKRRIGVDPTLLGLVQRHRAGATS